MRHVVGKGTFSGIRGSWQGGEGIHITHSGNSRFLEILLVIFGVRGGQKEWSEAPAEMRGRWCLTTLCRKNWPFGLELDNRIETTPDVIIRIKAV